MTELATDFTGFMAADHGRNRLQLAVEGMHCAGCAMKIEKALNAQSGVEARVNVTRRQLTLVWDGARMRGNDLVAEAQKLGFRFSPVTENIRGREAEEEKFLLRCMAVAGFSAGNIMVFSLALWFSDAGSMGGGTRGLFHWFCALIALPTVVYAGRPFFRSAFSALQRGRTNMDVPISVGVLLASAMSIYETLTHGAHAYFDSVTMLLFLLLSGRYLDRRARGHARAAAENILSLNSGTASVMENGQLRRLPAADLRPAMLVLLATGDRVLADSVLLNTPAQMDTAALTGETLPQAFRPGDAVLAGMVNAGAPVRLRVEKAAADSLQADIVKLMEKAEQGNAAYVRLADRIAGYYTPVVHMLALAAFLLWWGALGMAWQPALMIAVTVLIITCPCALGLAVPVVQVLASQWLFRRGMLVKAADAFERLAKTDTVVFDKTGTLTTGEMRLRGAPQDAVLQLAASLAAQSGHPLSRALGRAWTGPLLPLLDVVETPGGGVAASYDGAAVRLGSRAFCGVQDAPDDGLPETWLTGHSYRERLVFEDTLRPDAADCVAELKNRGLRVVMLSGDRAPAAAAVAAQAGIAEWHAGIDPKQKMEFIARLAQEGRHAMMVGDGINDAPSLLRAYCSMSPSAAMQVAQNAADIVFQGASLAPVATALRAAVFCQKLVRQNFALAILYNVFAVPLAVAGHVTPLVAAVAMSCSSLAVTLNALRFGRLK
jgi:Cu2+-exporting ATPase